MIFLPDFTKKIGWAENKKQTQWFPAEMFHCVQTDSKKAKHCQN